MTSVENVFLVVGGTGGIGQKVVGELIKKKLTVAFTFFNNKKEADNLEKKANGKAKGFFLDISEKESPEKLVYEIENSLGPIVGLVNNPGKLQESVIGFTKDEVWDEILDINLGGTFRVCRAVIPYMIHRREGSIVNVSSLSAIHPLPGQTAYAAAKAGILGFTKALAREVGKRGIRINAVLPGFLETGFTAALKPDQIKLLRSKESLPSGVDIDSVMNTIVFLLLNQSNSITGQAIIIDAGTTA